MPSLAPNFAVISLLLNVGLFIVLSSRLTHKACEIGNRGVDALSKKVLLSSANKQIPDPWYPGQPNPLREWFDEYSEGPLIHKWLHYFDIYHRHLARFRGKNATIVEFGVQSGGSMKMWKWYFGEGSKIFGVDINSKCRQFEEDGVRIIIGDEGDRTFLQELRDTVGVIDVVIEDGSHIPKDQIAVFEELYPAIQLHGIYLVEDLHTAYWSFHYSGGFKKPGTMIEYIKDLLDELHTWHHEVPQGEQPRNTSNFHMTTNNMHLYDSVMVIEKVPTVKPMDIKHGTIEIPYLEDAER